MSYEVITTDQADADLRGIYEYIAFELLSPDNAARQLCRLLFMIGSGIIFSIQTLGIYTRS